MKSFRVGKLFEVPGYNVYQSSSRQLYIARPSMGCYGKRLLGFFDIVEGAVQFREPKGQPLSKVDRAEILSLLSEGAFDRLLDL